MYDDILLPIDATDSMTPVVDCALDVACVGQTTVHLLYVVDTRAFLTLDDPERAGDELRVAGETALDAVEARFDEAGIEFSSAIRRGDPATEIVAHAANFDVDAVVMGAHADYEQNMLGSVSQGVLARATVPVLTVPLSAHTTPETPPADD
jgi:nucleotide-binding universal stress UspA family protein